MTLCARRHGLNLLRVGLAAALCAALTTQSTRAAQPLSGSDSVTIHAEKQGDAVAVQARAVLIAPLALIWETLTDYDKFHTFIPGMQISRVMDRRGSLVTVKQQGEAGFLIFTQSIDVMVEALEKPPYAISVRVLSGNLKKLDGRYHIEPDLNVAGQFVLQWFGTIEPQFSLPPLIGVPILRANISDQFRGMVREIERRTELLRVLPANLKNSE